METKENGNEDLATIDRETEFEEQVQSAREVYDNTVKSARNIFDAALLRACATYCRRDEETGPGSLIDGPPRNAALTGLGILLDLAGDQLRRLNRKK